MATFDRPAPTAFDRVAVGFTAKSGWASVVLLTGAVAAPRVIDSRRIDLSDPAIPESRQPYHDGFGTARSAGRDLTRLIASVERFGIKAVDELLRRYRADGHLPQRATIVAGSLIEPERIANAHIRIHAREGQLFRSIIAQAAARHGLTCSMRRERDLYRLASDSLAQPESALREKLTALGKTTVGPWRAEEKAAALAAWLGLGE